MPEIDEPTPGNDSVNKLYMKVVQKHILYTDDIGWLPIRARSGNQYVMFAYHSLNIIIVEPFLQEKIITGCQLTMPLCSGSKKKISLLTYTFLTMNAASNTRQPFKTGGKFSSNFSLLSCTGKMCQSKHFKNLKLTSSPSLLV